MVGLEGIRADGWFEQLESELDEFDQLCEVVGPKFLAFSFVLGVQIVAVSVDPQSPDASVIEFGTAGGDNQSLTVSDFRERIGAALLSLAVPDISLPEAPKADEVRDCIGRRYLLLAPIFGLRLIELRHGAQRNVSLLVEMSGVEEELSLSNMRSVLDNAIRSELARARPASPFSIDFKKVPEAEAANESAQYDKTIGLLGAWPGPLSMFVRTPQAQALGLPERAKLIQGLSLLGEAYIRQGQSDWAEDILRLAIQFGQELPAASSPFALLGEARLVEGHHGEAIGLLRRALHLGGDRRVLLPQLADCFLARRRYVAAMACLDEAADLGVSALILESLNLRVRAGLGDALDNFRKL